MLSQFLQKSFCSSLKTGTDAVWSARVHVRQYHVTFTVDSALVVGMPYS